jgi:5-methylcytosine-specific restriction endonuclease McrA
MSESYDTTTTKHCTKCGERKPGTTAYFGRHARKRDGLRSACKVCESAYGKVYYANNAEKRCANTRKWRLENPEKNKTRTQKWRTDNAEKVRATKRARYARNPDKAREDNRTYYAENLPEMRAQKRAYRAAHPEEYRAAGARHRALKKGAAISDFTAAQWLAMKEHYGYRCVYCGRKMQRLTQDHITPLSKGGNHTASNIVPACARCNSRKHVGPPLKPVQPLLLVAL